MKMFFIFQTSYWNIKSKLCLHLCITTQFIVSPTHCRLEISFWCHKSCQIFYFLFYFAQFRCYWLPGLKEGPPTSSMPFDPRYCVKVFVLAVIFITNKLKLRKISENRKVQKPFLQEFIFPNLINTSLSDIQDLMSFNFCNFYFVLHLFVTLVYNNQSQKYAHPKEFWRYVCTQNAPSHKFVTPFLTHFYT